MNSPALINLTMTGLTSWLSPSVMHSLGWTLLHFLWQGTALSALAAVLMTLCRRASARYALSVVALALMLAAPVTTFLFLTSSGPTAAARSSSVWETPAAAADVFVANARGIPPGSPSRDALPWLVEAWLLGVAFFSLRSAGGFLLLERERRKQSIAPSARVLAMCHNLQHRLGLDRTIRYCECLWLQAPAVIGWFRPIVLLPVTALTGLSEEQLQSVIAHELAHIQRLDPFVNLFQIAVETLLFYHPAVWWLNKRIRAEREHCCDDIAVSLCGNPVEYARALTLMEAWRSAPVLAMAANRGPLSERIFRVLGRKSIATGTRGIGLTGGLLCLTVALVAGNGLLGAYPKRTFTGETSSSQSSLALFSPRASSPVGLVEVAAASPQTSPGPASAPAPAAKPSPAHSPAGEQQAAAASYIDAMKAAGLNDLTVDQLIALKIQNVTPDYVRGMQEQGVHPDVDTLIAMRIQGVSPEYIRDLRGLGLNPKADEVVALKIQGVDADYVRGLKEAGIQPGAGQLIALKIQGVSPEYVRGMRDLGLELDADHLIAMRIQRVTPDYIRDIRSLGLKPDVDELIAMRIQDVTAEYIKGLQAAGLKFDVNDVIGAKIQGITKEFIDRAVKHGFQNLSLQKLIQLKHMGVLDAPGEI
jgi:beta-lactamase regulating signal transducer with metallopeptidase domain